jgi:hypothetical protein
LFSFGVIYEESPASIAFLIMVLVLVPLQKVLVGGAGEE